VNNPTKPDHSRSRSFDGQNRPECSRLPGSRHETWRDPFYIPPLQSGVGNIANAVLGALGRDKTIPAFEMYTEVIQDSVIALMKKAHQIGSTCSLTVTNDCLQGFMMISTSSATN
jgi:acyl-CoA hydrolase